MKTVSRTLGALLLAGLTSPAPAQDKKDDKDKAAKAEDVKKLQGTWKIVSGEAGGKPIPVKDLGIERIVIADQRMALKAGDKEVAAYPFRVFPDRKPKGMTWTNEKQKADLPLIYELDGDKLKLCFPLLGTKPPKEAPKPPENFDTKDKPVMLLVAEREKKKP